MSLYAVQKLIYLLNRDSHTRERFSSDREALLNDFALTRQERDAILAPDIGLLYVLGVNGQLLMHYAALHRIGWDDYLALMREGIRVHGPVREGVYALSGYQGVAAHDEQHRARPGAPQRNRG